MFYSNGSTIFWVLKRTKIIICSVALFLRKKESQRDQEGSGQWAVFITLVPKVLEDRFLIHWLNNFGDFY